MDPQHPGKEAGPAGTLQEEVRGLQQRKDRTQGGGGGGAWLGSSSHRPSPSSRSFLEGFSLPETSAPHP